MSLKRIITEEFLRFNNAEYIRKFKDARKKLDIGRSRRLKDMTMPEASPLYKFFEEEAYSPSAYASTKNVITTITPREFLGASAKGNVNTPTLDYFLNMIEETGKLTMPDIPFFIITEKENEDTKTSNTYKYDGSANANSIFKITGHEGRHRALIFTLLGFTDEPMPLRLTSWRIRFKEIFKDNQITIFPQLGSPRNQELTFDLMYID